MGKILLTFGVKAIIVVRAEVAIKDTVASRAGPKIYNELINGKSIAQAFYDFKDHLKNYAPQLCVQCCCEHDHDPDCPWILKKNDAGLTWEQVLIINKGPQPSRKDVQLPVRS